MSGPISEADFQAWRAEKGLPPFGPCARVRVLHSASGRFNGLEGVVTGGRSVVRVVFDDGRAASFWHEDLCLAGGRVIA